MDGKIEEFSFTLTSLDPDIQLEYSRDKISDLLKTHLEEPVKFSEKIVLKIGEGAVK